MLMKWVGAAMELMISYGVFFLKRVGKFRLEMWGISLLADGNGFFSLCLLCEV